MENNNIAQKIFDECIDSNPELRIHSEKLAVIITQTAQLVHQNSQSNVLINLVKYLDQAYKILGKKKIPAKMTEKIKNNPKEVYKLALDTIKKDTVSVLQQYSENYLDIINDDDISFIGEC